MVIQLNSQVLVYEVSGEGSPVILLHGNGEDHHVFDELVETMKADHTVYAIDSRGHGESAKPKELHYADMAEDVINFIKALEIKKPAIVGHSDGAIVGLLVAIKKSGMISGLVACGANMTPNGLKFGMKRKIKKQYKQTNDVKSLMMLNEPNISEFELGIISVPVLVIAGEKDDIKPGETKKIAAGINNSTLKIIPKADHSNYIIHTDMLYREIKDFLG